MNLLDIAQKDGRTYRRVSSIHGGEYHGPCPSCGGTDRFHVWPEQGDYGTFWCRGCSLGGDAIEYLMKIEGMPFPQACKEVGKELPENEDFQKPTFKRPTTGETFTPRETSSASELWIQHAVKLGDWAHDQLLNNPLQLEILACRGLDLDAVKKYKLGWNPGEKGKDLYRAREAWGLPTLTKEDGKAKKLWLPVGLVIPYYFCGTLQRIRIRRPEGEPRYYLVPGSNMAPMILGESTRAYIIVESELDALLIHHLAGDLIGVISQGNSTAKPDDVTAFLLKNALSILVALDSDKAGMEASTWWQKHFPQAERWPVPIGKDPGEAWKAGLDIREWIKAGLPPVITMPKIQQSTPVPSSVQDNNSGAGLSAAPTETEQPQQLAQVITSKDGRQVFITDNRAEYDQLVAQGKIVFDSKEIAFVKLSGADQEQAAKFLDAKQTFPGCRVISADPDYVRPIDEPKQKAYYVR
jgi:DNA primase